MLCTYVHTYTPMPRSSSKTEKLIALISFNIEDIDLSGGIQKGSTEQVVCTRQVNIQH